jgi:hypothetical protein
MDAMETAESMIETMNIQFDSEMEILFFFLMVYEIEREAAVQAILGGGTGGMGTTGTSTGTGTGNSTGTGTGTTGTGTGTVPVTGAAGTGTATPGARGSRT